MARAARACRPRVRTKSWSSSVKGARDARWPTATKPSNRSPIVRGKTNARRDDWRRSLTRPGGRSSTASGRNESFESTPRLRLHERITTPVRANAALFNRAKAFGAPEEERGARHHEMAHDRAQEEAPDGVLVEARGQLPAQVEEIVELEDLAREPQVHVPQLGVDEAVLDGRGRAGGHAAEEGQLILPVGSASRPAVPGAGSATWRSPREMGQSDLEGRRPPAARRSPLPHGGPGSPAAAPAAAAVRAPACPRTARGRYSPPSPRTSERSAAHLELAHHDEERRVQDLALRSGCPRESR